jgi:hypothetical protein
MKSTGSTTRFGHAPALATIVLILASFACNLVSPPGLENGTTAVETPADAGANIDLSQALMALTPEAQEELRQPLDVSGAAGVLKATLSSIPAAEILGQQLIDDLVAAIDELEEASSTSTSGGSGRLAILANPTCNGDGGDGFQAQKSFEQDGFSGDVSVNISTGIQGDRVVTNIQYSSQLQGTATDKIGQVLDISYSLQGDQDACPTAEGKSMGTFSGHVHAFVEGADTSFGRTSTGSLQMETYNADDGTLERGDLSFEGSISFEVNGQSWSSGTYSSQAKTDKIKDFEAILTQLIANIQGGGPNPSGQVREKVTDRDIGKAILWSLATPLMPMVPGNEMAEKNWQTYNKCVEIKVTPDELRVAPGDSETVEVEVVLKADGGSVAADLAAWAKGDRVSPEKASSSPGAPASFTYTAPDDGPPGYLSLTVTSSKAGKAHKEVQVKSPKIEWSGTFTMAGSATIPDVGTSQGTTTFTIRFQADLNEPESQGGDPTKALIPFDLESDASMTWSGTATAVGKSQPFSGSTSNLITPNYSNPEWPLSLPDGDCLAGEGYVDWSAKKLYLFLLGIGDQTGYGTFNLSPNTTCNYYHDQATNRVYLIFPLDDEFKISDGSCWDKVSADTGGEGAMTIQSSRSWHFETKFVSEE